MTHKIYHEIESLVNKFNEKNVKHFNAEYAYKITPLGYNEKDDLCGMYITFYHTFFSTDLDIILELKNKHYLSMMLGNDDGDAFIYLQ